MLLSLVFIAALAAIGAALGFEAAIEMLSSGKISILTKPLFVARGAASLTINAVGFGGFYQEAKMLAGKVETWEAALFIFIGILAAELMIGSLFHAAQQRAESDKSNPS